MSESAASASWQLSWRADPVARAVADRHYNRQAVGAAQFVPPGACVVLRTPEGGAAWIGSRFAGRVPQQGGRMKSAAQDHHVGVQEPWKCAWCGWTNLGHQRSCDGCKLDKREWTDGPPLLTPETLKSIGGPW